MTNLQQNIELLTVCCRPTKFKLLLLIMSKDYTVRELSEKIERTSSATSIHLNTLLEVGIVTYRREAQTKYYQLNKTSPFIRIVIIPLLISILALPNEREEEDFPSSPSLSQS